MDQTFINKVSQLTGKDNSAVQEMLEKLSVDQVLEMIDMDHKGNDDGIKNMLGPVMDSEQQSNQTDQSQATQQGQQPQGQQPQGSTITKPQPPQKPGQQPDQNTDQSDDQDDQQDSSDNQDNVEEAMSKKNRNTITVDVPKPTDPMAKALATDARFQVRGNKDNKRQTLDKQSRKHKGRVDDSFSLELDGKQVVEEGVLGFSSMPALKRVLELAGRPSDADALNKAMEDFMGDMSDFEGLSINDIASPVGTSITPGIVSLDDPETDLNDEPAVELEIDDQGQTTNIQAIRDGMASIQSNLSQVKVSEFPEVRNMMRQLMSIVDRLGNDITGK